MTILLMILTKNALFRSYSIIRLPSLYAYLQYKYALSSARGHELSGHVHADAYNSISAPHYYAPWPCMIHERDVILKAALHSIGYLCLAAASYIILLYCLVHIVPFFLLVWGT